MLSNYVPFETTHYQHLEVELRCDAHKKVSVEVIVVGNEGASRSTSGDSVHHWSFNLGEITTVKVLSHVGDDLGSGVEDLPGAVVDDEVQVALSEAVFFVLEAVVFGRHSVQTRCKEDHLCCEN